MFQHHSDKTKDLRHFQILKSLMVDICSLCHQKETIWFAGIFSLLIAKSGKLHNIREQLILPTIEKF